MPTYTYYPLHTSTPTPSTYMPPTNIYTCALPGKWRLPLLLPGLLGLSLYKTLFIKNILTQNSVSIRVSIPGTFPDKPYLIPSALARLVQGLPITGAPPIPAYGRMPAHYFILDGQAGRGAGHGSAMPCLAPPPQPLVQSRAPDGTLLQGHKHPRH